MRQEEINFERAAQAAADTRRMARQSIPDNRLAHLEKLVLSQIRGAGARGMTCDEVEIATGLPHQTASARVNRLMTLGVIVPGEKRKTRSGRLAVAWKWAAAEDPVEVKG